MSGQIWTDLKGTRKIKATKFTVSDLKECQNYLFKGKPISEQYCSEPVCKGNVSQNLLVRTLCPGTPAIS